jgi:hypothetical protein
MTRPLVVDTFMFNNELDMLELRLTELGDAVDWFILVEASRDHQDHSKPLHFAENRERYAAWSDKIIHVAVPDGGLPSIQDDDDPWAREHHQREHIADGLNRLPYDDDTVILQSDVDEIPRALQARNVRPGGKLWSFAQRGHFWAVDWLYPEPWFGTVATTVGKLKKFNRLPFAYMRDSRLTAECPPHLEDAGWHLSWLGGPEVAMTKVGSFCHPEVEDRIVSGLASDRFYRDGFHVDGKRMSPVDVDESWPKWIVEGNAPASWYRPR